MIWKTKSNKHETCKITFGAETKDCEVYDYITEGGFDCAVRQYEIIQ